MASICWVTVDPDLSVVDPESVPGPCPSCMGRDVFRSRVDELVVHAGLAPLRETHFYSFCRTCEESFDEVDLVGPSSQDEFDAAVASLPWGAGSGVGRRLS